MDIVYILGKGSLSNNDELRFSLRSLEKYMTDLGTVYIVGEKPDWITNIIHLPCADAYKEVWLNMISKVRFACKESSLSSDFFFMNDDFFATEYFSGSDFPFYARKVGNGGSSGVYNFEVHRPMRFNKEAFLNMPLDELSPGSFFPKTFYANFYKAPPEFCKNVVLRPGNNMPSFSEQINGEPFFTIDDVTMLDPEFRQFIYELYPDSSKFEL